MARRKSYVHRVCKFSIESTLRDEGNGRDNAQSSKGLSKLCLGGLSGDSGRWEFHKADC